MESITLAELAQAIEAELVGDGALRIHATNTLESARQGELSFLANPKYADQLESTAATAVIVGADVICPRLALLRAKDPYFAFMKAAVRLYGHRRHPHAGIHPGAWIDPKASVGAGSVVYPGVYLGPDVVVGRDCILYPNVVVYEGCRLGDRVIIHSGAVIGSDGYGFATHDGIHHKIPQTGNVVLEDDVEIGANTSIARAAMGSTLIGRGTKMDALVAVGHGVKTGPHCLLVAQVGISGSTSLGHHVVMGGQVGVAGHVKIGDGVMLGAQTGVISDVEAGQMMMGSPHMPAGQARRVYALLRDLPVLQSRVRALEKKALPDKKAPKDE